MSSEPPLFNCPRRLIALARPHDVWKNGSERWGTSDTDHWPEKVPKPRTCSYCGGIHPDDAIPLLVAGWHIEHADKPYKLYLLAPVGEPAQPPCETYLRHWTQEQVMRADGVIRAHRLFTETNAERSH